MTAIQHCTATSVSFPTGDLAPFLDSVIQSIKEGEGEYAALALEVFKQEVVGAS